MTTWVGGKYQPDDPHITVSYKNSKQVEDKTHQTGHGYTKSSTDLQVVKVKSTDYVKPDATADNKGKPVWPSGLKEEEKYHKV